MATWRTRLVLSHAVLNMLKYAPWADCWVSAKSILPYATQGEMGPRAREPGSQGIEDDRERVACRGVMLSLVSRDIILTPSSCSREAPGRVQEEVL